MVTFSVADPGFPRPGRSNPEFGTKPVIWQDFCPKLNENERNYTGDGIPSAPFGSTNAFRDPLLQGQGEKSATFVLLEPLPVT